MNKRFLIVEAIEDAVIGLGHEVAGIAACRTDFERIDEFIDVALVDVNLLDGPTGPEIGRELASRGCCVIFMTANPEAVAHGVEGTLGVIAKPGFDLDLIGVIEFAVSHPIGNRRAPPSLQLFEPRTIQ